MRREAVKPRVREPSGNSASDDRPHVSEPTAAHPAARPAQKQKSAAFPPASALSRAPHNPHNPHNRTRTALKRRPQPALACRIEPRQVELSDK